MLTISEHACLDELADAYKKPDRTALNFSHFVNYTGLTAPQVKRAVRGLAKKGLAELSPAYGADGMIRGSGYVISPKGWHHYAEGTL